MKNEKTKRKQWKVITKRIKRNENNGMEHRGKKRNKRKRNEKKKDVKKKRNEIKETIFSLNQDEWYQNLRLEVSVSTEALLV